MPKVVRKFFNFDVWGDSPTFWYQWKSASDSTKSETRRNSSNVLTIRYSDTEGHSDHVFKGSVFIQGQRGLGVPVAINFLVKTCSTC